jgi:hypothetical protein
VKLALDIQAVGQSKGTSARVVQLSTVKGSAARGGPAVRDQDLAVWQQRRSRIDSRNNRFMRRCREGAGARIEELGSVGGQ